MRKIEVHLATNRSKWPVASNWGESMVIEPRIEGVRPCDYNLGDNGTRRTEHGGAKPEMDV